MFTNSTTDPTEKIASVIAIYNSLNISEHAKKEIDTRFTAALKNLGSITISDLKKEPLRKLAKSLMDREN